MKMKKLKDQSFYTDEICNCKIIDCLADTDRDITKANRFFFIMRGKDGKEIEFHFVRDRSKKYSGVFYCTCDIYIED